MELTLNTTWLHSITIHYRVLLSLSELRAGLSTLAQLPKMGTNVNRLNSPQSNLIDVHYFLHRTYGLQSNEILGK